MVDLKFLVLLLFVVSLASGRPPIKDDEKSAKLDSNYIVVFNENVNLQESLSTVVKKFPSFKTVPKLVQVYHNVLSGFAITDASKEALEWFAKQDYIDFVEKSTKWTPNMCDGDLTSPSEYDGNRNSKVNWGLDRITERTYTSSYSYSHSGNGSGVYIYVIDEGIQSDHEQFGENQVRTLPVDKAENCQSGIGSSHGTWVASVVGAKDLGTATGAYLTDVNVGCNGAVTTENLVKGFDAIWGNVSSTTKCVIVMSFTVPTNYTSVYTSIKNLATTTNCIIVASAGNFASSASQYPAAYSEVISVGAVNANNKLTCFSNFGSTVDIYAPGTNIWAARYHISSTTKVAKVSGTSFSAPFVAGVAAIHLGRESASTVRSSIIGNSTTTVTINGLPSGSHNRILYVD